MVERIKCSVCGYIETKSTHALKCPVCGCGPEKFIPLPAMLEVEEEIIEPEEDYVLGKVKFENLFDSSMIDNEIQLNTTTIKIISIKQSIDYEFKIEGESFFLLAQGKCNVKSDQGFESTTIENVRKEEISDNPESDENQELLSEIEITMGDMIMPPNGAILVIRNNEETDAILFSYFVNR